MDVLKKFTELKENGQKALLAFLPGNYPTPEGFIAAGTAVLEGGADILEIGIPFSEPIADGPVISEAYHILVERKENILSILASVNELSTKFPQKAFVIMSYANPLLSMGVAGREALMESGVSAVIVPDIPFEEKAIIENVLPDNVKVVAMLAPTTSPERRKNIVAKAESFVYCVAVTGVTGERSAFDEKEVAFLEELHDEVKAPLVIGFGISQPEHARLAVKYADGVVIGSKLTRLANNPEELKTFINDVKAALNTR